MLRHAKDARDDQVKRLQDWEREINAKETAKVVVENEYDLEGPPRHMNYVTMYKVGQQGLEIKKTSKCT